MEMNQKGHGLDLYQTPPALFNQLNDIFQFTVDAACDSKNKLCNEGFCIDEGRDGLKESWAGHRVFCNPPFSVKSEWIKKAHEEVDKGGCAVCVMILPTLSESIDAFQDYIFPRYWNTTKVLRQRVAFINPETGLPQSGNNSGTTIIIFMKEILNCTEPKKRKKK